MGKMDLEKMTERFVGAMTAGVSVSWISFLVGYHPAHLLAVPTGMALGWLIIVWQQLDQEKRRSK